MKPEGYEQYHSHLDLAKLLGVPPRTIQSRKKSGKIPPPDVVTSRGDELWSPETVDSILKSAIEDG